MEAPDQVPLSALQHWRYCPRQCGLIHLEQVFDDSVHTLRRQAVHAKVDKPGVETAKGVRVERALPLWSDELGLVGKSDVVEFLAGGVPYPWNTNTAAVTRPQTLPPHLSGEQAARRCRGCARSVCVRGLAFNASAGGVPNPCCHARV
jgi:hypothetical protein